MISRAVRWWQDSGAMVVEVLRHGAYTCGRCGALTIRDGGQHYRWHRDVVGDAR